MGYVIEEEEVIGFGSYLKENNFKGREAGFGSSPGAPQGFLALATFFSMFHQVSRMREWGNAHGGHVETPLKF